MDADRILYGVILIGLGSMKILSLRTVSRYKNESRIKRVALPSSFFFDTEFLPSLKKVGKTHQICNPLESKKMNFNITPRLHIQLKRLYCSAFVESIKRVESACGC